MFEVSADALQRLQPLWPHFVAEGKRTGLSPHLLAGISWGESSWRPDARGPNVPSPRMPGGTANGLGLMQLMSFHDSRYGGHIVGLMDRWKEPAFNIGHGADLLADQVKRRGGVVRGLAGYGGFVTWLQDRSKVAPGSDKDASWYIDEALGRALVLEWLDLSGRLK
jgi:soluble lytic murein transglycosylase-like protein